MWTDEMRAKAAATRAETKRLKMERQQKKEIARAENNPVVQEVEAIPVTHPTNGGGVGRVTVEVLPQGDVDWELDNLAECLQRASELKRDYERISAILIRRQNPANRFQWRCWTQENLDKVPVSMKYNGKSVRGQCLKDGDGVTRLPKFTDNGNFVMVDGVRTLKVVNCCNFLCYSIYNATRVTQKIEGGR
jgi:hypothetical protein